MCSYTYTYRAKIDTKDEFEVFTLQDGLCLFAPDKIMLQGVEVSPILKNRTFLRGNEDGSYFEGDLVKTKGDLGTVVYNRLGFCVKLKNSITPLSEIGDFKILPIKPSYKDSNLDYLSTLKFKHNSSIFNSNRILGKIRDALLVGYGGWHLIDPFEVQQFAFYHDDDSSVFFGDELEEGIITLISGRICGVRNGIITPIFHTLKEEEETCSIH